MGLHSPRRENLFLIYPKTPEELAATQLGKIRDSSNKMRKVEALNEERMKLITHSFSIGGDSHPRGPRWETGRSLSLKSVLE